MIEKGCQSEPMVAIFWLVHETLVLHGVPLTEAETSGRYLNAPSHEQYWSELRQARKVPPEIEYDSPPRGRVIYDLVTEGYHLFADRCILDQPELVKTIIGNLGLSRERVEIGPDLHYRCEKCLERIRGKR